MNTSNLYRLGSSDFIKGIITAIFAGVFLAVGAVLHGVFTSPGFDLFLVDWTEVARNMINASVIGAEGGFVGYITKNFFSDENGAFLGSVGGPQQ